LEKKVTDDKHLEKPERTDATTPAADTSPTVETRQEDIQPETVMPTSENTKASSSSDAEEIRQILKAIPARGERGTVTFTKDFKPVKKRNGSGWGVVRFFLLALILLGLGAIFYIRQQLSPVSTVSAPVEFEVEPGWGVLRANSRTQDSSATRVFLVFICAVRV
jgi:hypothetical protein